jgi:glutamine amidotransferase
MIVIVDYQMGNLRSVQKALEHVGQSAIVSSDPANIAAADHLILPGVGAFGDAIDELNNRSLMQPIRDFVESGKPFLGICLGLQMLFEIGMEGSHQDGQPRRGLEILPGSVERFPPTIGLKVPHMGWNQISVQQADCPLLTGIEPTAHFYFVHSYFVAPKNPSDVWLTCDYGSPFCAAVWKDNLFATQFHPEKSQQDGLRMLENFAKL